MPPEAAPALRPQRLRELVAPIAFVTRLEVIPVVDSTNDAVRRLASCGAPSGTTVVAGEQRRGRGRRGRDWYAPRGLGLYVSTLIRSRRPAGEWTRWTLGAAVAACQACHEVAGVAATIKWPNDVLCAGRKVCGVLTEARALRGEAGELVVGSGFNVYHRDEDFPEEIRARATALQHHAPPGMLVSAENLLACYLQTLGGISELLEHGAWDGVAARFVRLAPGVRGRRVRVGDPDGRGVSFSGRTAGLEADGALRVERERGGIETVRLAESVREMES